MNNPMGMLFQMMRSSSPQQFIQNIASNNAMMNNPLMKNVVGMAQSGDMSGVEQMARNLCQQKGINPDDAIKQIKQQFGI